ncbi:membrane protein [Bacteroidia bacterium]|nr:membrane protein [Bacteroidia bacterium]
MLQNSELTANARQSLEGKWSTATIGSVIFLAVFMVFGVSGSFSTAYWGPFNTFYWSTSFVSLVVAAPMSFGFIKFIISLKRDADTDVATVFSGFKQFPRVFAAYFLQMVLIFLWSLLLIVPGIIKSFSYSQTFFILADDDKISPYDAILRSKELMYGYKWKYFCLTCRFIGWAILCCFTFGIGVIWLLPYMQMSCLNFYEEVKAAHNNPVIC